MGWIKLPGIAGGGIVVTMAIIGFLLKTTNIAPIEGAFAIKVAIGTGTALAILGVVGVLKRVVG